MVEDDLKSDLLAVGALLVQFPGQSWNTSAEKGSVENRNRKIRRFFPKGTDFTGVSDDEIAAVEYYLNNRPMKCLGYATPYEKMRQLLSKLKST